MTSVAHLDTVPWFLPGLAIAFALGFVVCGPLGRVLGVGKLVAWLSVVALGLIVATTLTPQREALDLGAIGSGTCDFSRVTLASLAFYAGENDAGENVLLFVPLGVAVAMVPRSRRKFALVVGAVTLPFVIEAMQRQVVVLNRACQSADVVDNLAGLAIGLVVGGLLAYAGSFAARRRDAAGGR